MQFIIADNRAYLSSELIIMLDFKALSAARRDFLMGLGTFLIWSPYHKLNGKLLLAMGK